MGPRVLEARWRYLTARKPGDNNYYTFAKASAPANGSTDSQEVMEMVNRLWCAKGQNRWAAKSALPNIYNSNNKNTRMEEQEAEWDSTKTATIPCLVTILSSIFRSRIH